MFGLFAECDYITSAWWTVFFAVVMAFVVVCAMVFLVGTLLAKRFKDS